MGINTQIEVTDLHKSFGKNEVLKGITTKFEKGDVVLHHWPFRFWKINFS